MLGDEKDLKQGYENRKKLWLSKLDEFCKLHEITRKQAISILYIKANISPRADELFWSESYKFFTDISNELF